MKKHSSNKVSITDTGFDPASIEVKHGAVIEWVNDDDKPHTVTFDAHPTGNPAPSGDIAPGESFKLTATTAGTFGYRDEKGAAKGTVKVT